MIIKFRNASEDYVDDTSMDKKGVFVVVYIDFDQLMILEIMCLLYNIFKANWNLFLPMNRSVLAIFYLLWLKKKEISQGKKNQCPYQSRL